jgi:hypothetical protein
MQRFVMFRFMAISRREIKHLPRSFGGPRAIRA